METIYGKSELTMPFEIKSDPRRKLGWETEMERLHWIYTDVLRLRKEMRDHEFYSGLRCLIILGVVCAAWYFRAI